MSFISRRERELFDTVVANVEKEYGVDRAFLLESRARHPRIVKPRQLAMYALRERAGLTYPAIGFLFRRDHTTVIHACEIVRQQGMEDESLALLPLSTGS